MLFFLRKRRYESLEDGLVDAYANDQNLLGCIVYAYCDCGLRNNCTVLTNLRPCLAYCVEGNLDSPLHNRYSKTQARQAQTRLIDTRLQKALLII